MRACFHETKSTVGRGKHWRWHPEHHDTSLTLNLTQFYAREMRSDASPFGSVDNHRKNWCWCELVLPFLEYIQSMCTRDERWRRPQS